MIDRESTFADDDVVAMLKNDFIPVAIDQWYTRLQDDAEGRFYQSIARQGPRSDMNMTTQGLYVCDAAGKLIGYNNNRHVGPIKEIMRKALREIDGATQVTSLKGGVADPKYDRSIPAGSVVIQVNGKVLGGYEKTEEKYQAIFQRSISRDNLWILEDEKIELLNGNFPESLARRIARFHLIDSTRGEPMMWKNEEVKSLQLEIDADGNVLGFAQLKSKDGKRGYEASIRGVIETEGKSIKRFDLVSKGLCYGDGPYTQHGPKGKFPLAIAFRIADSKDSATTVAPQGSKGWLDGYLKNQ